MQNNSFDAVVQHLYLLLGNNDNDIEHLLVSLSKRLTRVTEVLKGDDLKAIIFETHLIAGEAASCGLDALKTVAAAIEVKAKAGEMDKPRMAEFNVLAAQYIAEINNWLVSR
jgi:HPt (histidine-containing phosphotransfer) domain-containing protein